MNTRICPTCHAPIPAHAPGGFCPACLLRDAEEPPVTGRAAPSLEEISAAFPQFEIIRLIGQGGMGFVYQVRQPGLDRTVALKVLSPELGRDPAFAERFAREARALGKLNHPNIVTVFEHGESDGFFYLLMEFVDGVNLRQAMRAGRFTPEQALAIVPGICDALQAAHAQGIWHRDIKPENILLDARGGVKIADFGIARMVGDPQRDFTLTNTGGALGSAAYMAPEQHENPRDVDHRADIYSLGVVIYEMLTDELPLGRFPAPSRRAAVSARIDEIVFRTLEKERELRQQSATEVKTDVQGVATHMDPQVPHKPDKDQAFRGFAWSVGLWIGGIAGVIVGLFTAPLLTGLGLVVAVMGLIGCGWILWRIRQGLHPQEHRMPLLTVALWPTIAGISYASVIAWFLHFKRSGFDSALNQDIALYGYAFIAITVPLLAARLLWNGLGSSSSAPSPRLREGIQVALAVILASGAICLVKFVRDREASYRSYQSKFIQIYGEIHEPEDLPLIREALDNALGANRSDYHVRVHGSKDPSKPRSIAAYETPCVVLEYTSSDRAVEQTHFQAIADRLRAGLPKRLGVNAGAGGVSRPDEDDAPLSIREGYRRVRPLNILLVLAPITVVLLTCALTRRLPWLVPVFALLTAATLDRVPWPGIPDDFPLSIDGLIPLPPLPMPEYDSTTARYTTVVPGEKTRWQINQAAAGVNPAETIELHGKLDAKSASGDGYTAATVLVGEQPLFMIVGYGSFGGYFSWQSNGRTGSGGMGSVDFELSDENKAIIEDRAYDLTRGRVFLVRPDKTLRQIATRPERELSGKELKEFVAALPPEK